MKFTHYYWRIYVGGHHEVWCNKLSHIRVLGDAFGTAPINTIDKIPFCKIEHFKCDCDKYIKERNNENS